MKLTFENGEVAEVGADSDFRELLDALNPSTNPFAILSRSDNFYMQTLYTGSGYELEKRDGNAGAHFVAARISSSGKPIQIGKWWQFWKGNRRRDEFTLNEIADQFSNFVSGGKNDADLKWVKLEFNS
ncbi:hypothetical protein [Parasphingorhabdus sp.]|jgi:hypothetical protein|uniref:hypothetical protein n=1 Tax=Parasphingorhabdus sp. TaxID=2709688 RepID=UPI003D2D1FC9